MSNNIKDLDNILKPLDLIKIFRALHTPTEEYTLFSSAPREFTIIDRIVGQKPIFNKFKMVIVSQRVLSDQNSIQIKTNNKDILMAPKYNIKRDIFKPMIQEKNSSEKLENNLHWVKMKARYIKISEGQLKKKVLRYLQF